TSRSASQTTTRPPAASSRTKASRRPSGDHTGKALCAAPVVSACGTPARSAPIVCTTTWPVGRGSWTFHPSSTSVSTYAMRRPSGDTAIGWPPAKVRTARTSSLVKTGAGCANAVAAHVSMRPAAILAIRRCMEASCTLIRMRASALVAILVLSCAACRGGASPAVSGPAPSRPPIVLITIDTLRADRLGSYGSKRGLTPALGAFAGEAARFTAAVCQVPLTLPSHATILTGLHPAHHGIRTNDGFRLAPAVPTLAESLRAAGYRTGAFIGGYPLKGSSGLARGF